MLCALLCQQLLVYLFFGSQYNSSVGSSKSRLQNVNSQYQYAYGKALTSECLVLRAIFLTLPDALDEMQNISLI